MKKYDNFISIGFFCSVALELERVGLRSSSSPFDWLICSVEGMSNLIKNKFDHFLDEDLLLQDSNQRNHYYNPVYNVWFFHEFSKYKSLNEQIGDVQQKYRRRINRFYEQISNPTLLLRYIANETELTWWNEHIDEFTSMVKEYNEGNDILFIANEGLVSDKFFIYNVEPDENDDVARKPLEKNEDLKNLLESFHYSKRQDNLIIYNKKQKNKELRKIKDKFLESKNQLIEKEYIHSKII